MARRSGSGPRRRRAAHRPRPRRRSPWPRSTGQRVRGPVPAVPTSAARDRSRVRARAQGRRGPRRPGASAPRPLPKRTRRVPFARSRGLVGSLVPGGHAWWTSGRITGTAPSDRCGADGSCSEEPHVARVRHGDSAAGVCDSTIGSRRGRRAHGWGFHLSTSEVRPIDGDPGGKARAPRLPRGYNPSTPPVTREPQPTTAPPQPGRLSALLEALARESRWPRPSATWDARRS